MESNRKTIPFLLLVCAALVAPVRAGTLLVANKTDDTVDLVDPATGTSRATLPTGHAPHEIAVSPDGGVAVISNYGDRAQRGSTLTVVDVRRSKVLRTIDLKRHEHPHGLAWLSKKRVVVTTEESEHILVVDPHTGRIVSEVETGQRISHMVALARGRAFVANIGSGSVTVIDVEKGEKLMDIETGEGAEGVATTPDGKHVWVTNRSANTLSILDAATLEIVATIDCAGFPIRVAITPDGKRALVSCAETGEIVVFDVAERRELVRRKLDLSTVETAASRLFGERFGESPVPVGVVIAPDGRSAWVAATQSDIVVVVDPRNLEVLDLIRTGQEPDGMAFSPVAAGSSGS